MPKRWRQTLNRERAVLNAERTSLIEARLELAERESRIRTHQHLATTLVAALRRKHEALAARERELEARERALAPPPSGASPMERLADPPDPARTGAGGGVSGTGFSRLLEPAPAGRPASGASPVAEPPAGSPPPAATERVASGTPRLDDLLLGGFRPRSHVVLVGDAFVGKEVVLYGFIAEGLRHDEPALLITTTRSSHEVGRALRSFFPELAVHERAGRLTWIDASGSAVADEPRRFAPKGADDLVGLSAAVSRAARSCVASSPTGRFRVGFLGLSAVLSPSRDRGDLAALQGLVGVLRAHGALAMYSLEAGAVSEAQLESLLGRMDGALLFRQERGRTLLSAKGFGGVATTDWVESRATERGIVLGSFALQRIR
jgi:KaiC